MAIRIDHIRSGTETVVNIAGNLSGNASAQLMTAFKAIKGHCVIDLSSLRFADQRGIDTIRAILKKGVKIRGASPFIQLLLENAQHKNRVDMSRNDLIWS